MLSIILVPLYGSPSLLALLCKWRTWGSERLSNFPKATLQVNDWSPWFPRRYSDEVFLVEDKEWLLVVGKQSVTWWGAMGVKISELEGQWGVSLLCSSSCREAGGVSTGHGLKRSWLQFSRESRGASSRTGEEGAELRDESDEGSS